MRLLVTGASGQLGAYVLNEAASLGTPVIAWSGSRTGSLLGVNLQPVNLARREEVAAAFRQAQPTVVIHAAAMARIADCCKDPGQAQAVNTAATRLLAELAAVAKAKLIYVSTDLVFDGERGGYREEDVPCPLSVYGKSKAEAEADVLAGPGNVVTRVSLLFGPSLSGRPAFFDVQLNALREECPITLFADEWRTPLGLKTAAQALLALARSDFAGMLHVGGPERMSRVEMGRRLAGFLRISDKAVVEKNRVDFPSPEPRPCDVSLNSSQWRSHFSSIQWPRWEDALREMF
jgi:dTDP-4-dehydrorhamnose reductase